MAGDGYQLDVDFVPPWGTPSGTATITLTPMGPVTYPTLSDPSNITSPMVLTSGGGTAHRHGNDHRRRAIGGLVQRRFPPI